MADREVEILLRIVGQKFGADAEQEVRKLTAAQSEGSSVASKFTEVTHGQRFAFRLLGHELGVNRLLLHGLMGIMNPVVSVTLSAVMAYRYFKEKIAETNKALDEFAATAVKPVVNAQESLWQSALKAVDSQRELGRAVESSARLGASWIEWMRNDILHADEDYQAQNKLRGEIRKTAEERIKLAEALGKAGLPGGITGTQADEARRQLGLAASQQERDAEKRHAEEQLNRQRQLVEVARHAQRVNSDAAETQKRLVDDAERKLGIEKSASVLDRKTLEDGQYLSELEKQKRENMDRLRPDYEKAVAAFESAVRAREIGGRTLTDSERSEVFRQGVFPGITRFQDAQRELKQATEATDKHMDRVKRLNDQYIDLSSTLKNTQSDLKEQQTTIDAAIEQIESLQRKIGELKTAHGPQTAAEKRTAGAEALAGTVGGQSGPDIIRALNEAERILSPRHRMTRPESEMVVGFGSALAGGPVNLKGAIATINRTLALRTRDEGQLADALNRIATLLEGTGKYSQRERMAAARSIRALEANMPVPYGGL